MRKNAQGRYECAYGHHRLAAAMQAGLIEADFIVKEFDDELMIKVMDNENREAYGTSPLSLIESVRAVVKGLADGRVKPFVIAKDIRKDAIRMLRHLYLLGTCMEVPLRCLTQPCLWPDF